MGSTYNIIKQAGTPPIDWIPQHGCILSNGTDVLHDIKISAGVRMNDDYTQLMKLSYVLNKRFNSAFVTGDNNGGMCIGESLPVNGTIHIWLISTESGIIDVCANNHGSSGLNPTLPSGYIYKRRIVSITTDVLGKITQFKQVESEFFLANRVHDINTPDFSIAQKLELLSIPQGNELFAKVIARLTNSSSLTTYPSGGLSFLYISNGFSFSSTAVNMQVFNMASNTSVCEVLTNTSAQCYSSTFMNHTGSFEVITVGWRDPYIF